MSFLVGAAAALALLASWQVAAGPRGTDTALSVSVTSSPAAQLSRTGTLFDVSHLRRGRPLVTRLLLSDNRAETLRIRTKAEVSGDETVANAVWTTVNVDGDRVFAGPLTRLTRNTARRFWLQQEGQAVVLIRLVLPRSARGDLRGRYTDASLVFEVTP
jgi:hypothetical protein